MVKCWFPIAANISFKGLASALLALFLIGCANVNWGSGALSAEETAGEHRRAVFKCSDEEPFWSMEYSSTQRLRLEPGDTDIIETITPGGWASLDDDAGVYVWREAETARETMITRARCINVASEELSYRMASGANRYACCRRFTE